MVTNCPNCGTLLNFSDSQEFGFCQYCGTRITLGSKRITLNYNDNKTYNENKSNTSSSTINYNENKTYTYNENKTTHNLTATNLFEIHKRYQERARTQRAELLERAAARNNDPSAWKTAGIIWAFLIGMIILVFIFIFAIAKGEEVRKNRLIKQGKIIIPMSSDDYIGEYYPDVVADLEALGFINIELSPYSISETSGDESVNTIRRISINGESKFYKYTVYEKDAVIRISYYSLENSN